MVNLIFQKKVWGWFLHHILYIFSRKMFLVLYAIIIWPNFIVWLPLLLEILGNMCIGDIINFEINLVFLIKPFFYMTKSLVKNLNILKTKRAFKGKLSGSWQILATVSTLKMMKNAFYFTLKATFILKMFKFLPLLFGHVDKRHD